MMISKQSLMRWVNSKVLKQMPAQDPIVHEKKGVKYWFCAWEFDTETGQFWHGLMLRETMGVMLETVETCSVEPDVYDEMMQEIAQDKYDAGFNCMIGSVEAFA